MTMRFAVGVSLALLSSSVLAQQPKSNSPWQVELGAMGLYTPEYEGSDDHRYRLFPNIDIKYKDSYFLNGREGLGVNLINSDDWKAGLSIGYRGERKEKHGDLLRGMGDVGGEATANAFAEYSLNRFKLGAKYKYDVSGDTGALLDLSLSRPMFVGRRIIIIPSISAKYADSDYMQSFFGVDSTQAANSGNAQYSPDAGFKSMDAGVLMALSLTKQIRTSVLVNYSHLLSDAKDSPIVEDDTQYTIGVGVSYKF